MAIKIPIITVFDNKGLRAAQYQLNKVSGSFSALGRNFAIAGTAVGVFATGLGLAVKAASNFEAEYEGVNQVFGKAARSVQDFARAASETAGLSETAALQGAKTFGLFARSAQLGEEEAAKFATSLVQLAGDLGSFNDVPTEEALAAIQSGLMGQAEPLRKFGVFLTDTKLRAEAQALAIYNGTGALNDQQKMLASYSLIMKDTEIQQGDFVKYQNTFGNAFKTVQKDIENITKDIGMELLPIIAQVTPIIGQLAREFGWKLANAVKSVDWESVIGSLVEFFTFVVSNIDTITRLATSLFLLNTAFNAVRAASGLYNAAATILNATFTVTAGKIALTTGALKLFKTALVTTGIGALVVGLGFIIEAIINTNDAAEDGAPKVTNYGGALQKSGADAAWAASKYGIAKDAINGLNSASANYKPPVIAGPDAFERRMNVGKSEALSKYLSVQAEIDAAKNGSTSGGGSSAAPAQSYIATLNAAVKQQKLFTKITTGGTVSEGLAADLLGGSKGLAKAKEIAKGNIALATKLQTKFNKTAAGVAELKSIKDAADRQTEADNAQALADQREAQAARDAAIAAEKAAADERERIYQSFADSVKSIFGQIKDSILNAFTLPSLGSSTDAIIRNMGKLLTKTREFSNNITQLSSMGLDPVLLRQIISEGPIAGAKLAASLVAGGASGLAAINTGYSELSGLGSAIGMTGTNAVFGAERQQNIYNIEVNGGVGSGATIGQAIVDAIKAYERTSGAVWQGA
jgi:hypothetical protein